MGVGVLPVSRLCSPTWIEALVSGDPETSRGSWSKLLGTCATEISSRYLGALLRRREGTEERKEEIETRLASACKLPQLCLDSVSDAVTVALTYKIRNIYY